LATHVERCADCRINGQLMADFERSGAPAPGDELVLGRTVKAALARRRERRPRALRLALAAALVLLVAGAARSAVLLRARLLGTSAKGDELHRRPDAKPPRGEAGTPTAPAELVARRAELDAPPAAPPPDVPA